GIMSRPHDTLFGESAGTTKMRLAVAPEGVLGDGKVVLDGGLIVGIGTGTELVRVEADKHSLATRIRVVELQGLNKSLAETVGAPASKIETGDLFELDKWVPTEQTRLQAWLSPATLNASDLEDFADEMSSLQKSPMLTWVNDPAKVAATH